MSLMLQARQLIWKLEREETAETNPRSTKVRKCRRQGQILMRLMNVDGEMVNDGLTMDGIDWKETG